MTDSPQSILVVDDDKDICAVMADILIDMGYHVAIANDGKSALELVRKRPYDIALLDLKMPGMDGLTLYREIKNIRAEMVAMLVTAYAGDGKAEEAVAAGAWQVLAKPVDVPRLANLIAEAVQQPLVLVVDDDNDYCDNLWDLLRGNGYRVCVAHNANQAVEQLRESTRMVLLDLKLPDRSGTELFQEIHTSSPDARILVITGFPTDLQAKAGRLKEEGVDAVYCKPLDVPSLVATMDRLAEEARFAD